MYIQGALKIADIILFATNNNNSKNKHKTDRSGVFLLFKIVFTALVTLYRPFSSLSLSTYAPSAADM